MMGHGAQIPVQAPVQGEMVDCRRWQSGEFSDTSDVVSREESLLVSVLDRGEGRLWAHPVDLDRLVLGHAKLTWCGPAEQPELVSKEDGRWILRIVPAPLAEAASSVHPRLEASGISRAMAVFIGRQGLWNGTGCFHRAGVYDTAAGEFLFTAEDIGRHNCLDRLAGWLVENGRDASQLALFVSARLTASLMAKAMATGYPFCVSRSAVTSAALDLAEKARATVVGFARSEDGRFTLFADPQGRVTM